MQNRFVAFISLTILVGLASQNCEYYPLKTNLDYRYFQIKVNNVSVMSPVKVLVPDSGEQTRLMPTTSPLVVTDTMRVRFQGWVGHNGCHEFSHFDATRIDLVGYKISIWGRVWSYDICTDNMVELHHTFEIYPPLRIGTWIFLVSQPDGSVLRKEVVVQQ